MRMYSAVALVVASLSVPAVCAASDTLPPPAWAGSATVQSFTAIEEKHLAAAERAIDKLLAAKGKRTADNTLVPLDAAVEATDRASYLAAVAQQAHPQVQFRDAGTAYTTRAAAAQSAIMLNPAVYRALSEMDLANADTATRYYVRRLLLAFQLAGVDKADGVRTRLKQLSDAMSEQISTFDRNISDDKRSIEASPSDLAGLPADYIARHPVGENGKVLITTDYPDAFPVFTFAKSADLRRRLRTAFDNRGFPKNSETLRSLLKTRQEIATILGYPTWADYNAADKMIATGANIRKFIDEVDAAVRPFQEREYQMILAAKRADVPGANELGEYEATYYSELVRRTKYDFDSQSVRPYFPFGQVKRGILDTAADLFNVSFEQVSGAPVWDPSVETWLVRSGGTIIGRFYLDMHPREGKFSHAQMVPVQDGIRGRQLPEAVLLCNFPKPAKEDPGLMDYDDVGTFLHEFGHLMHHIIGGQQRWAGISGINLLGIEFDFIEAPSQMLERWIESPQVLAKFAHHYQTRAPIPVDLVTKMNRAAAFGRASWVARQVHYTALSYDFYSRDPLKIDFDAIADADMRRYTKLVPLADTHDWASFGHLGVYSSAYYTYLWDTVIALDLFAQFNQNDLLAGAAPQRYRSIVLEPGSSKSANDLIREFLGRPHNTAAFEAWVRQEVDGIH